jgi:nitrile hydratase
MARFQTGDHVRVCRANPPGHVRTPYYVRGKSGTIERVCGTFLNPEELAFGRTEGPKLPLYRVRFRQSDVWPGYEANANDTIDVELYEHWLEPAAGDPS